jgi:hypothetical protein
MGAPVKLGYWLSNKLRGTFFSVIISSERMLCTEKSETKAQYIQNIATIFLFNTMPTKNGEEDTGDRNERQNSEHGAEKEWHGGRRQQGTPYQMALGRTCSQVGPGKTDALRDSLGPQTGREE